MPEDPSDPPAYVAYYETSPFMVSGTFSPARVRLTLGKELQKRRLELYVRSADGTEEKIPPSSRRISHETAAIATAVLYGAESGAEVDSVVAAEGDRLMLASLWWEPSRIVIAQATYSGALLREGPEAEVLRERYGTGALVDGDRQWDALGRGLVEEAFRRLGEEERAAVRYLALYRNRAPMGDPNVAALYFRDDTPRIELYDAAVSPNSSFVGPLQDPSTRPLSVLLHELGHGLMYNPERTGRLLLREIQDAIALDRVMLETEEVRSDPERYKAMHAQLSRRIEAANNIAAWLGSSPVLDSYLVAVGDEPAPTTYGRTRGREAFAEAFALWHLDRDALVRTSPKAAAFFDAGRHLSVLREAVKAVEALAAPGL